MTSRIIIGTGAMLAVIALTACSATIRSGNATQAATAKACRTLEAWENGNASDTLGQDPASVKIQLEAAPSSKFARDFHRWLTDHPSVSNIDQSLADANRVQADCRAAGVRKIFSG